MATPEELYGLPIKPLLGSLERGISLAIWIFVTCAPFPPAWLTIIVNAVISHPVGNSGLWLIGLAFNFTVLLVFTRNLF